MPPAAPSNARYLSVALALAGPFYLNDFASIHVTDWRSWLAIDYAAVKLLPLALVAWLIGTRRMTAREFGLTGQRGVPFLCAFLGAALAGTLLDQNGYRLLAALPGYPALGRMPEIGSSAWNRFDLTAGLLLVGIVEELVFRAYACTVIERYTRGAAATVAISSIAFGLAHWSLGLNAVLVTAAVGAVFMAIYLATRSAPALMLAHFIVNFIDFAGVVPKSIFRLV
ncbi:MAG: CPBP family intramembrane metalloprotease [Burkholderiales bacterium]|nr:CPBP family intramembrane metalloprotease [Burkholderiales bacterium]